MSQAAERIFLTTSNSILKRRQKTKKAFYYNVGQNNDEDFYDLRKDFDSILLEELTQKNLQQLERLKKSQKICYNEGQNSDEGFYDLQEDSELMILENQAYKMQLDDQTFDKDFYDLQQDYDLMVLEEQTYKIQQLETDVIELTQKFSSLSSLVNDRRELVNSLENYVENSENCIQQGNHQLRNTSSYKNKIRKMKAIFGSIMIAILTFIITKKKVSFTTIGLIILVVYCYIVDNFIKF